MPEPAQDAESVADLDEYGRPVSERYRRLGARGLKEDGMYVRFEPGFGLNVHIGFRRRAERFGSYGTIYGQHEDVDRLVLGIQGWERLCELVDEWRERTALIDGYMSEVDDTSPRESGPEGASLPREI